MWQRHDGDGRRRSCKIFYDPQARKQVSRRRRLLRGDAPGDRRSTRPARCYILALISLSLAVVNLFPFLPLDGGHIFWALAEKVRGRPIPFAVMERASVVGFVLVAILFVDRPHERHRAIARLQAGSNVR